METVRNKLWQALAAVDDFYSNPKIAEELELCRAGAREGFWDAVASAKTHLTEAMKLVCLHQTTRIDSRGVRVCCDCGQTRGVVVNESTPRFREYGVDEDVSNV
jgi:hypothetical protein